MNNKQIEKLKRDSLKLAGQINNCLDDDFDENYKSDIRNWQKALKEIKDYAKDK